MLGDHGKGSIKPVADHELPNRYFCGCRSVLSPVCGSCGERHSTHPDATHSLPPSRMNSTLVAGFMSVRAHRWQTRHPDTLGASGDDVRGCRHASGGGCCGALPGAPIWVTARRIDSVFTRQQTGPNGINLWAWTPNLGSGCREMRHRSPSAHPCHLTDPQRDRDRAAPALPLTTCLVTGSGCPAPSEDRHSGPLQSSLATRSRRTESRCARYGAAPSGAPRPASRRTRSKRAAPRPTAPAPRSRQSGRPHSGSPALHCPSSRCESR